ncbi:phage tail tape measure protein [Cellulomonas denverensis]
MGNAMKYVGVPAAQLGVSLEQTAGAIALFASNGIIGEQAGTSLRSMIASLTSPSQVARKQMDELGITVFDAQGKFIGLDGVAGQLHDRLGELTDAERANALGRIFGNEALQAANVLTKEGAAGVQEWTRQVNDQGYAAEQAATRMDNLKGDIEGLSGSFETLLIGLGEGANGPLRSLVQGLDAVVDSFNGMSDGAKNATMAVIGGGGLATLGVAGLGKLVVGIAEAKAAMDALKISGSTATTALGAIGAVLYVGTSLLSNWANAAQRAKSDTGDFASTLDEATGAITDSTEAMVAQKVGSSEAARIYKNLGGNVQDLTGYVLGQADAIERVNTLLEEQPKESFFGFESDSSGVAQIKTDLESINGSLDESQKQWALQRDAAGGAASATGEATSALQQYTDGLANGTSTVEDYASAISEVVEGMTAATNIALAARDAQRGFEDAIDSAAEALKENGQTLDITTEAGRENQAALDGIASSGTKLIDSLKEQGAEQSTLQATMQATRDRFIEAAGAFGMSADEASALADELGLIPENVVANVQVRTAQADADLANFRARQQSNILVIQARVNADPNYSPATTGGVQVRRARGGILPGAPSSTDNMLIHAASGEFVVNAMATARNRGLLEAINSGASVQQLASGGEVGRQYVAPAVYHQPSGPTSRVVRQGDIFPNATIVAADPQEARKELSSGLRLEMAGRPL